MSKEEFFQLVLSLYDRVRGLPHYQVAMVGWEVSARTHLEELKAEWADEISDGSLNGLVVAKKLLPELPRSEYFTPFDDEHDWIPYSQDEAAHWPWP